MERAIKKAKGRHSDQKYYLTKILCEKWLLKNPNPEYTKEDNQKKLEIFDIPDNRTCFVTGLKSNGTGDHIYEINNYHKYTGRRGINDQWNIVPVVGSINKKYKKIKFTMSDGKLVKKDIGYQKLTEEEKLYLLQSEDDTHIDFIRVYRQLEKWNQYVVERGAVMSFVEPNEFKQIRIDFRNKYDELWRMTISNINDI